ncbi:hypothetical protein QLQ12_20265 [Actinoplanes sp. NEAU-A12]|uniref:DUF3618 domain-containing protein n=1 Tax=Actinoplanes sandaracinus TaxID=3045177 RepID=A0ABT6WMI4_9ACTN|nr:hypothetical protein [Actinoplanes sandaracinus]MDI6100952.1 hypothetical protein [Actinoplanes sandaracinus]
MTTISETTEQLHETTENGKAGRARQAVSTARVRATETVRRNPKKSATATTLVLAAAAAAAVLLNRRRTTKASARGRNRLAALLHR